MSMVPQGAMLVTMAHSTNRKNPVKLVPRKNFNSSFESIFVERDLGIEALLTLRITLLTDYGLRNNFCSSKSNQVILRS